MVASLIDFSPLDKYAGIFRLYIWTKRIRMLAFRLLLVWLFMQSFYQDKVYHFEYSSETSPFYYNPLLLVFAWFMMTFLLIFVQNYYWTDFAKKNDFSVKTREQGMSNYFEGTEVPSFKGKTMQLSFSPLTKKMGFAEVRLFTRIYKEGGILRWRERKMDTVLALEYKSIHNLPHIILNSTQNERARRSNLSRKYDKEWKFSFEGAGGAHYDAYTDKQHRILALQLFTPDVLSVAYQAMPNMDIEVKGQTIWFVARYGILDAKLATHLFEAVQSFQLQFEKQMRSAQILRDRVL